MEVIKVQSNIMSDTAVLSIAALVLVMQESSVNIDVGGWVTLKTVP